MKGYKAISLGLMLVFGMTGILFLVLPDKAIEFFNSLAASLGTAQAPASGWNFYLILAAGYMYLVSVLAYLMFRHPENPYFPLLLTHAKLASSLLSLALYLLQAHYPIYLANFAVDAAIGGLVITMNLKLRKREWAYS